LPTSSDVAIRVEGLGKRYHIGARQPGYRTIREKVNDLALTPFRAARSLKGRNRNGWVSRNGESDNSQSEVGTSQPSTIWALRDVSFEVMRGEVVGVIGRNGAGKSTLLKVLSRITEPTTGTVDIYGRVGSLLEVGTGFHPELTGRENIFLNGAILGMRKMEIARKFDEIVAFAEVEKFIDTPVKHYSSGMYVRLAFAVAAHLESEILLVDEVLAVGDADFQKRCLGKMEEVGSEGRTVLFVSHSMPMITRLCKRAILLNEGGIIADGSPHAVIGHYLCSRAGRQSERIWSNLQDAPGDSVARLRSIRVLDEHRRPVETTDIRRPLFIEVEYWNLKNGLRPTAVVHFINEHGICLFASNDFNNLDWWRTPRKIGLVRATCHVPGNLLAEGRVFILAAICSYNPNVVHVIERDAVSFQVVDHSDGDGVRGVHVGEWPGVIRPMLDWEVMLQSEAPQPVTEQ
jgi:lipopolysaccharide transport system ATP-binding protein